MTCMSVSCVYYVECGGLYLLAAFMLMLASDFLHVLPISKKKLKLPMFMKIESNRYGSFADIKDRYECYLAT